MKPILDFKTFQRIFEADEPAKEGVSAIAPLVLSLYFQAYGELASKVEGYKDVVKDLQAIMKAEVDKKPEVIEAIAKKIAGLVKDAEIKKELEASIVPAVTVLGEAYKELLKTASDEDKKKMQEAFSDGVLDYQNSLIQAVKSVNENYFIEGDPIVEKNTFKDDRSDLIRDLNTLESGINMVLLNPPTERIKGAMSGLAGQVKELKKELSDDAKWEGMKRKARKDRVQEIPQLIAKIKEDQNKAISDEVVKSGIEKTVLTKIQDAQAKLKTGTEKIGGIVQKNIETAKAEGEKKTADEKAKEAKELEDFKKASLKLDDYKEIVTGKKEVGNLQKKGKNLKTIQKIQELLNNYLEKPIKADGLYGEGTEKAIAEVSKALSLIEPEVKSDGKVISPLLQAMLMKIEEKGGKEKVKQVFAKVSKEGDGEEKAVNK
jgi:hypothetical protein